MQPALASARTGADIASLRRMAGADTPGRPLDEMSFAVVGARFDNPRCKGRPTGNRRTEILLCEPGEPVLLVHETTNRHDANAIAAFSARGVQIGYLSADKTPIVHKANGEGRQPQAIFQAATDWGCYIRVAFGGRVPQLPPSSAHRAARQPSPARDDWDGVDDIPEDW
jgi:hypothetical protein